MILLKNIEREPGITIETVTTTDWIYCTEYIETLQDAIEYLGNLNGNLEIGEIPAYKFPKGKNKVYFNNTFLGVHKVL